MTLFWPQTRPKQTFWSLIVNNTNQGQILPPKICPTNCQPIFFITQCDPNNRHPNLWLNNFLPNKLQPNDNSKKNYNSQTKGTNIDEFNFMKHATNIGLSPHVVQVVLMWPDQYILGSFLSHWIPNMIWYEYVAWTLVLFA